MSHQIVIRIPDDLLAFVDDLVDRGSISSRASFAREAMERERRRLLAEADIVILRTSTPNDDLDTITRAVSGTSLDIP
jgi:Arc/MetJ-type ribon-helix-helix transcriptional regulator